MPNSDAFRNGFLPGGPNEGGKEQRDNDDSSEGNVVEGSVIPDNKSDENDEVPHTNNSCNNSISEPDEVKITVSDPDTKEDPSSPPFDRKESLTLPTVIVAATAPKKKRHTPCEICLTVLNLLLASTIAALVFLYLSFPPEESNVCLTKECVRTAASLLAAMDLNADPCENFFQYACGTWNKRHIIPADRSAISTFEVMNDQLQLILRGLLEEEIKREEDQASIKAKIFYASCMNTSQLEIIGDSPMKKELKNLGGWPVTEVFWNKPNFSVETLLGILRGEFHQGILIEQWVGPDDKNSSVNILQLEQMELGIPSRDIYLSRNTTTLSAYLKYMIDVAELAGATRSKAEDDMKEVLTLETRLANASLPEIDRHDSGKNYMKMTLRDLQEEVPQFNWMEYFNAFLKNKFTYDEPVVVYTMPYFKRLGNIMQKAGKRILWNYALWRLVMEMTPHLTHRYQSRRQEFRTVLLGIPEDRSRWNQCIEITNKKFGMAVGALFIKENFNHESKETAIEMIRNLRQAFSDLLEENEWMDDETRSVAREKANAMNEKIGYPEMLTRPQELEKEYKGLLVRKDRYLENVFNYLRFEATKNLGRLRKAVDKNKWSTAPAVLNAFYNPNFNDIVFPAGILQPLFYSRYFPKSLNYGGIGVVIGHEMTHGFDDKGRQFDKDGNLKQWWNNRTIRAFRDRAQCIVDQYSRYKVEQVGQYMNGRITQGENIADNGGIKQAYRAYRQWVARNGNEKLLPGIDLNHDQLFFLNYAQIWCGTMRPEDAMMKLRSSVHSIGFIRVLGPLSNSYDFARAYSCPINSRMNPVKKCYVW